MSIAASYQRSAVSGRGSAGGWSERRLGVVIVVGGGRRYHGMEASLCFQRLVGRCKVPGGRVA